MWGPKKFSHASIANIYSNIPPLMRRGWRKGEMRGGQEEKERQNKCLPPPYTNPVYATGEEGDTGKLFNTVIARDFIFTSKFIKNVGSPNLLAILVVAASRSGMEKS